MITSEMLSRYEEIQENNHHGELLEVIAADLKLNEYKRVFNSINTIHSVDGFLAHDLMQVRERFRGYLKTWVMTKLPESEAKKIIRFV